MVLKLISLRLSQIGPIILIVPTELSIMGLEQEVNIIDAIDKAYESKEDDKVLGYVSDQLGAQQPLALHVQVEMGIAILAVDLFRPQHMRSDAVRMDLLPIAIANVNQL